MGQGMAVESAEAFVIMWYFYMDVKKISACDPKISFCTSYLLKLYDSQIAKNPTQSFLDNNRN